MLVSLSTSDAPALGHVGGKAASLIRLQQAGFNVPPGMVLTTDFFAPWIVEIQASTEWRAVTAMLKQNGGRQPNLKQREHLAEACGLVKTLAARFQFDAKQNAALRTMTEQLGAGTFAVRSSSPEEDLSGASFAGLYETVLDVAAAALPDAVRTCFQSCLDARVLLYKLQMKFASVAPSIAVVVQRLVASEVSGVAFSLNPLTNDYDEVLINAAWGLGEALVSGDITPDSVVLNKVTGEVVEYRTGDKGGDRSEQRCLGDAQVTELAAAVQRIETSYEQPMDIEWAFAGGKLHVLQARPITSYVPLHPSLLTDPRAPRHLYMDGYLTDGITMSGATTPMADDVFNVLVQRMIEWILARPASLEALADFGIHTQTARLYLNLSGMLHLLGKGNVMALKAKTMNPMMAALFTSPEIERYRPAKPPKQLRIGRLLWYAPGVLWRARRAISVMAEPMFRRERFDANYQRHLRDFEAWVHRPMDFSKPALEILTDDMMHGGVATMEATYPAFMYFFVLTNRLKGLADPRSDEQRVLLDAVCGGYEDDMIVQMGLWMYDLSTLLPAEEFKDLDALAAKVVHRTLPDAFLQKFDDFMARYGCRGPLEMELANPRYGEAPRMVLQQIAAVASGGGDYNPHDMQRKQVRKREQAYEQLMQTLPPRKAKRLAKWYAYCARYSGSREYFKHHLLQIYQRLRAHLLHRADEFVQAGRLDHRDQIFQMTLADVDRAAADPALDVRAIANEHGAFARKLKAQVRHFPMAIDSRGRIMRPAAKIEAGALVGAAVSPGVARGPIKVMNDPFEKDVLPGDVLVAVTTDPGWTPLFIPAAAVILEIGGELQHGALVAREYGKPCVSSIQDVTTRFKDGQMVEVDGNAGVVRFLDADAAV